MLKSISCAALAAISFCAFGQSNGWYQGGTNGKEVSGNNMYYSDSDLWASPPTKGRVNLEDLWLNVTHQAQWLDGSDGYNLTSMIADAPGNIGISLLQALYNVHRDTMIARHDMIAQAVSTSDQMAMTPPPGYTYFYAQTPAPTSAVIANTDYSDVDNRPMRMALSQARVPNLTYFDASDILEQELTGGARKAFDDWFWNEASEQDRDVLVRTLKKDVWFEHQPIYASTLTRITF